MFLFQCGGILISAMLETLPTPLAITLQFVVFWLTLLLEGLVFRFFTIYFRSKITFVKCFGSHCFYKGFLLHSALSGSSSYWRWIEFSWKGIYPGYIHQPTEFNQLDHERKFKLVLGGLFTATTIYSLSVLSFTRWLAAGTDHIYKYSRYKTVNPNFQTNIHSWRRWLKLKDQAGSCLVVLQLLQWLVLRSLYHCYSFYPCYSPFE